MRVVVMGQGYVGLTAAVCLAEAGHMVIGVESDEARLSMLQKGAAPFYEPGLNELLGSTISTGRLHFAASLEEIRSGADALIVAVGSPQLPSGGADLRHLVAAMAQVRAMATPPPLVLVKSTAPPGTSESLLNQEHKDPWLRSVYVYCPEFLSQGQSIDGWRRPARVVVGLKNQALLPALHDLLRGIEAPWMVTTPTNAEMIKYASNAFLATKISLINEIANLCDEVGATIDDVAAGLSLDPRVGTSFLRAGVGYGGSCFPKDIRALTHLSSLSGYSMPMLEAVIAVNSSQRLRVVRILREYVRDFARLSVAVLGISFKPGTDDVREAPSLTVISELVALGLQVRLWDPVVPDVAVQQLFPTTIRCDSVEEATRGAGAAILLTEWPDAVNADWTSVAEGMSEPGLVIDGRNCLDLDRLQSLGLIYRGIGRGTPARSRLSQQERPIGVDK